MPSLKKQNINYGQPVNRSAPLNQGLVHWYKVLPQRHNGTRFIDLCGSINGNLINGPKWSGRKSSGEFGSLSFDAVDDYVNLEKMPPVVAPFTVCAMFNVRDVTTYRTVLSMTVFGADIHYFVLQTRGDLGGDPLEWQVSSNLGNALARTTTSVQAGVWQHACAVEGSATDHRVYLNGGGAGSSATSTAPVGINHATIGTYRGSVFDGLFNGYINNIRIFNRALTADEVRQQYKAARLGNVNELNQYSRNYWFVSFDASSIVATPETASLTLSSFAPTVSTPRTVTPTTLALTTATFAPTAGSSTTATPATASLTLTPFVPTVTATAPQTATPTTLALSLTTFAPTVTTRSTARITQLSPMGTPGRVYGSFAGKASSVTVTPTTAALVTSTFAPVVSTPRVVTPTTLTLSLTPFSPTVVNPKSATPTTTALVLSTFTPTVSVSQAGTVTPTTASLTISTFAPVVSTPRTVTPPTLALTTTKFAPAVSTARIVTPDTAVLVATMFAPTVSITGLQVVTPSTLVLTITGFAPIVTASGGVSSLTINRSFFVQDEFIVAS